jgi:hypothetical protein
MYTRYTLKPLVIIHIYGGGGNVVPTSINFRLLEDFFAAGGDPLVCVCSKQALLNADFAIPGDILLLQC